MNGWTRVNSTKGWTNTSTLKAASELINNGKNYALLSAVVDDRNAFITQAMFLCSGNINKENVN